MSLESLEIYFQVRYHELDSKGNLRLVTLLNYLQDTAGMHAVALGISVADLKKMGLIWVISRIHLLVDRYPRADEIITVRTWLANRHKRFTCREFELHDAKGEKIASATTSWAVLHQQTRRPARLDEHLAEYPLVDKRALDDPFDSLPLFPQKVDYEIDFRVLRENIDSNQHVNNTVYTGWAMESVPEDIAARRLRELEITFRAEALYGDSIAARCSVVAIEPSICCLHQIVNKHSGVELARLQSRWR